MILVIEIFIKAIPSEAHTVSLLFIGRWLFLLHDAEFGGRHNSNGNYLLFVGFFVEGENGRVVDFLYGYIHT